MHIAIKKTHPDALIPERQTNGAVGYDLCCVEDFHLQPGRVTLVSTGIAVAVPMGFEAQVRPRSGMAKRNGVTVLNAPGTIDPDYRGTVGVLLYKCTPGELFLPKGSRIAQMVFAPVVMNVDFELVTELSDTKRGAQGFGHTDIFPMTETFE